MPARPPLESTVPAVPTPLVSVELAARVAGAPLAVLTATPAEQDADLARVWFGPAAAGLPAGWRESGQVTGAAGEVREVPDPGDATDLRWLVGVGNRSQLDWRTAGAALGRTVLAADDVDTLDVELPEELTPAELGAFGIGLVLGSHRFTVTAQPAPVPPAVRLSGPAVTAELTAALHRAVVLASATALARDLANMPSNRKDPAWLAGIAVAQTEHTAGLTATVRDEHWLAEHGFGGILAVGSGSARPPRLIELSWRPRGATNAPHLVLIGKGVTFDTGGISLKQADGMHLMRTDMSGAGAVIAALRAIAQLKLPLRVTGLAPAAENHLSGSAYRPGDIVRHYDGRTTEVTNTDAEGRMLLADALGYAVRRLRPDLLVDVATLTGAMKVSLGVRTAGLFASDDEVAERVRAAGAEVGESWWRMPLLDEHAEDVLSEIADLRQAPAGPGGIMAALFLREFTAGRPWAHLDIAGPARADKTYAEVAAGGTGFAARTLVAVAESLVEPPADSQGGSTSG